MSDLELILTLCYLPLLGLLGIVWTELRTIKGQQVEALQRLARLEAKVLNGR